MFNVCVIGLGYVGLPILINLSKKFNPVGYDINDFILDEPIVRNGWKPKNFANKYRGKITLKEGNILYAAIVNKPIIGKISISKLLFLIFKRIIKIPDPKTKISKVYLGIDCSIRNFIFEFAKL